MAGGIARISYTFSNSAHTCANGASVDSGPSQGTAYPPWGEGGRERVGEEKRHGACARVFTAGALPEFAGWRIPFCDLELVLFCRQATDGDRAPVMPVAVACGTCCTLSSESPGLGKSIAGLLKFTAHYTRDAGMSIPGRWVWATLFCRCLCQSLLLRETPPCSRTVI